MRSEEDITAVLDEHLADGSEGASRWPGMTYEQGVDATIRWVLGYSDDHPMADS